MDIRELLVPDVMIMDLKATDKAGAIDEMVHQYAQHGIINDETLYKQDILKREAESTTGIGDGIAMPHAKDKAVQRATVLFAKSQTGVDFEALDGQPVYLFFMIAAPEGANNTHLQALASLSGLLINPDLIAALKKANTPAEVQQLFGDAQAAKEAKEAQEAAAAAAPQPETSTERPFIVAVSACPNGIAHTYMAEEALKKQAKAMNVDIKVETNGSEGVKHRLTAADIDRAQGVIITADKKVEMDRFSGKHLINHPVIDGIKKPEELIQATLNDQGPIYQAAGGATATAADDTEKKSAWSNIYASLMNGISNMLPFVVGGGILMAISFMVEQSVGAKSTTFLFLNGLGNWAFSFLVPVLAAYTTAIGVYTATGDGKMMAAVMVGGMVPPLATAVATTFWGSKFSADERKAGLSNYVLGLSFITEGAIPFAASDPLHVITSSVIGAAIGGGLSQFWHVSVPAPHGGLWVTPLATHWLFYVLSVVIGALIAGVLLGIWRPAKTKK